MKKIISLFLCCILLPNVTFANWSQAYKRDHGGRLYISAKIGGANIYGLKMKNSLGDTTSGYYLMTENGVTDIISRVVYDDNYSGQGADGGEFNLNIGDSKVNKRLNSYSFYSSLALGYIVPHYQNWRIEFGWDHLARANYDTTPLYSQTYGWISDDSSEHELAVRSGSITSEIKTDLYMFNFYYDFFDERAKQKDSFTPYIGFGFGYANIITNLQLMDLYGDLSYNAAIAAYGSMTQDPALPHSNLIVFNRMENQRGSIAFSLMGGVSYGISNFTFLDIGAKVSWIDKLNWSLTSENPGTIAENLGTKNLISAKNTLISSLSVGMRFEF